MKRKAVLGIMLILLSAALLINNLPPAVKAEITGTTERYALLLSGGVNTANNHARYKNDLSFIYDTLLNYYKFEEDHITTIYFDGSVQDLDGDGDDDIDFAATEANVNTTFNMIKASLDADDLFFIFVTDHGMGYDIETGGTGGFDSLLREDLNGFPADEGNEHGGKGYDEAICLWDSDGDGLEPNEVLLDDELATFASGATGTLIFVLEQCFSGGFIDDLSGSGRIIMTACLEEETSLAIVFVDPDLPSYDPFAYYWTEAVQGSAADVNSDGQISMQEAFDYAKDNDEYYTAVEYESSGTETCQIDDYGGEAETTTLGFRNRVALISSADSYVYSGAPNSNYGSYEYMRVRITSTIPKLYYFSYIKFDLTALPSGIMIQSANLSLSEYYSDYSSAPADPGPKIYAHYCPDNSWNESGITWNNKPSFDPVATSYIEPPSFGFNIWNVKEDAIKSLGNGNLTEVLKWPNYTGGSDWAEAYFDSRHGYVSGSLLIKRFVPKLIVEYSLTPAYLVVRGSNNGIYYRTYNVTTGAWASWNTLSGSTCDSPAATIIGNELHIVVRSSTGTTLYHGYVNLDTNAFSGWTLLSGSTPSTPTLTSNGTHLCLVVRGNNNMIYHRLYNVASHSWTGWSALASGSTGDSPDAALIGNELHVVVRSMSGSTLYYSRINLGTAAFSGWTLLSGSSPTAPTLTSNSTHLSLIVRGANNRVYYRFCNAATHTWDGWNALPTGSTGDRSAAAFAGDKLQFVVRGSTGGTLYHSNVDLASAAFSGWSLLSGSTPSPPTLTS